MEKIKRAEGNYNRGAVFVLLWSILFILYYPAANAGRVGDFPGWVRGVRDMPFVDYVNAKGAALASFYHFTQLATYFFFQLFGTNAWLWHLLFVTMQAVNGFLLFLLARNLCTDSGINKGNTIALAGTLLFCVCPHISEVVVWEPAYHYLQALMFILLILLCAQKYLKTSQIKYAWASNILFSLSTLSLEFFYLTPFLALTMLIYYRIGIGFDKGVFKRSLYYIALPFFLLFALHLVIINLVHHSGIGHIGIQSVTLTVNNISKPFKYIFHLLFFGRFFSYETRHKVYAFCESTKGLVIFYTVFIAILTAIAFNFKTMEAKGKLTCLFLVWSVLAGAMICPMWFPDMFLVLYDRYAYVLNAFIYLILTMLISYVRIKAVSVVIWSLYTTINIYFTYKINKIWKTSADIINTLVSTFPNDPSKVVLIMNVPQCFNGIQMLDARDEGHFKLMYNAIMPNKIDNMVYEVSSENINSPDDGAHVTVINDSTINVTLNQWGTWWWWAGMGSGNYENEYYKLNMTDPGHRYELILKKPGMQYRLLYVVGNQWKVIDMNNKNVEQY